MTEIRSEYDFWNDKVAQTTPRINQQLRSILLQGYKHFFQAIEGLTDLTKRNTKEDEEVMEVGGHRMVNFSTDDVRVQRCNDYFMPGAIYQVGVFDIADFTQARRHIREAAVVVRPVEEIGEERIFRLSLSEYIVEGVEQHIKRRRPPLISMEVTRPQVIAFKNGFWAKYSDSADGELAGGELGYLVLVNSIVRIFAEDRAKPYGISAELVPIELVPIELVPN